MISSSSTENEENNKNDDENDSLFRDAPRSRAWPWQRSAPRTGTRRPTPRPGGGGSPRRVRRRRRSRARYRTAPRDHRRGTSKGRSWPTCCGRQQRWAASTSVRQRPRADRDLSIQRRKLQRRARRAATMTSAFRENSRYCRRFQRLKLKLLTYLFTTHIVVQNIYVYSDLTGSGVPDCCLSGVRGHCLARVRVERVVAGQQGRGTNDDVVVVRTPTKGCAR